MFKVKCEVCGAVFETNCKTKELEVLTHLCSPKCLKTRLSPKGIFQKFFRSWMAEGAYFRSAYEAKFAKWLRDNGIPFMFEPFSFKLYPDGHKKPYIYIPDFYIPTVGFVELKGLWYPSALQKVKAFINTEGLGDLILLGQAQAERLMR